MRGAVARGVAGEREQLFYEGWGEPAAGCPARAVCEVPPGDEAAVGEELKHAAALAAGEEHGQRAFQDGLIGTFLDPDGGGPPDVVSETGPP